jgi:hypothetical protein
LFFVLVFFLCLWMLSSPTMASSSILLLWWKAEETKERELWTVHAERERERTLCCWRVALVWKILGLLATGNGVRMAVLFCF